MPVRNHHFLDANAGRAYPVDDAASAMSDAGDRLPPDLLVDAALRWPEALGDCAFVAAAAVTDRLVTLTFQAARGPDDAASFAPLAVVSVPRPVDVGRMYAVAPQVPGVGGWVAFGGGANGRPYRGRFASPAQARLTPRAARPYRPLPVTGLAAEDAAAALTGVVTLAASEPLAVAKEERFVDGANRDCVVLRLVDAGGGGESPFFAFAGPCGGRPESGTCGCPNPIEFVNGVAPDCDGTLTVEFAGCAVVAAAGDGSAAVVGCELGLVDACRRPALPSAAGLLPSEVPAATIPAPPPPPPPPPPGGDSDTLVPLPDPLLVCFFADAEANPLEVESGAFGFDPEDGPDPQCFEEFAASLSASGSASAYSAPGGSHAATSVATRNAAVYAGDSSAVYRRVTVQFKLAPTLPGDRKNAHLILNSREHPDDAALRVFHAVEVDYAAQEVRVSRFDGRHFATVAGAVVPGIVTGAWYKLTVTVLPFGQPGGAAVTARVQSVTPPLAVDETLAVYVDAYGPATGKFGLGSRNAYAKFNYMRIEEYH